MMGDLISREAALEALNGSRSIRSMRGGITGIWINLLDAIGEIERVPSAEPVRRGHWKKGDPTDANPYIMCCSECGKLGLSDWVCCPRCGAKMDGDEKNV